MNHYLVYLRCGHSFRDIRPPSLRPEMGESRTCHVCQVKEPTTRIVFLEKDTNDCANA